MSKKIRDMKPVCKKCGKVAPIDEKMSSDRWIVYKVNEICECGGTWINKFFLEEESDE